MWKAFDICEATGWWDELFDCLRDEALSRGMGRTMELLTPGCKYNSRHVASDEPEDIQ